MENRVKKFNDFTNESLNESIKETVIKELESEGGYYDANAIGKHKIGMNKTGADFELFDDDKINHKFEMTVCSSEYFGLSDNEGHEIDNDLLNRNLYYMCIWADQDAMNIPLSKDQIEEIIKMLQKTIK